MTFDGGIKDWMAGLEQVGESGPLQSAVWWVPRIADFFVIFILKRPHSAVNNPLIFLVTLAS